MVMQMGDVGEKGDAWLGIGAGMVVDDKTGDDKTGEQNKGVGMSYLGLVGMLGKSQLDRGV